MIVVCDTSPVNYLVLIDGIDLLPQLFTTVVLPAGVLAELQHPRTPPRVASWARQLPPWVRVISPKGPVEDVGLGRGEAEAIAIATQVRADAVLIDDARVFHGVTAVEPADPSKPAYRDVLVATFRRS